MLGTYYYHEILRKTIVAFGTLFNDIEIKHRNNAGGDFSIIKVPIAYGPVQKFLARIEQSPNVRKEVAITLPRMSFEMTGLSYDPSRKSSTMQTFKAIDKTSKNATKLLMPVPYNMSMRLSILSKLNEDALQIIEQILPIFQPHFNITVDLVSTIGEKRDIPITLNGISMDDQYEGDFTTRRALTYTLDFTVKTYLFGPVASSSDGLIREVQVDYHGDPVNRKNSSRMLRYKTEVRAIKDYDSDETTTITEDLNLRETAIDLTYAGQLVEGAYIQIDSESMRIRSITGNQLLVERGADGTTIAEHAAGTAVNVIDNRDDILISLDDEFGFSEYRYEYDSDGKVFSPSKGQDV